MHSQRDAHSRGVAPQVIIVDGTNLAFSAAADRNRWSHLGATLSGCFGEYIAYLTAATGRPTERYVVFDRSKVAAPYL